MKRYFELFFRHRILFVLPIVIGLIAGAGYAFKLPRTYVSSANVFSDTSLPNVSTLADGVAPGAVTPSADKMVILQEFLRTQSFLDKVAQRSPIGPFIATHSKTVDELAADAMGKTVKLSAPGPQILVVSAKSGSPVMAAGTVKAVIDEFTAELGSVLAARAQSLAASYKIQLNAANASLASAESALATYLQTHLANVADAQETALQGQMAAAQQQHDTAQLSYNQAQFQISVVVDPTTFHVVDPPVVPSAPTSRKKQLIMSGVGGLLGGFVITILALIILMAQDRSVREERDVRDELELEVVATVPQFDKSAVSPRGGRHQAETEGWLWTPPGLVESCTAALQRLERGAVTPVALPRAGLRVSGRAPVAARTPSTSTSRTIGVTSCLREEGRTTIAMGMAAAAYQAYGVRTLLVEFDFERHTLARRLGIDPGPGVAEILRDGASIEECLHSPDDSVAALVAGDVRGDPAGLYASLRRSSLVRTLGGLFDVVVADLPPLSPPGQPGPLAPLFETVVLVVRSGTAQVGQIRRALDDLDRPPAVILNGVESSIPRPLRALLAG